MRTGERVTERASRGGIFDMIMACILIMGVSKRGVDCAGLCAVSHTYTHRVEIHYILSS